MIPRHFFWDRKRDKCLASTPIPNTQHDVKEKNESKLNFPLITRKSMWTREHCWMRNLRLLGKAGSNHSQEDSGIPRKWFRSLPPKVFSTYQLSLNKLEFRMNHPVHPHFAEMCNAKCRKISAVNIFLEVQHNKCSKSQNCAFNRPSNYSHISRGWWFGNRNRLIDRKNDF